MLTLTLLTLHDVPHVTDSNTPDRTEREREKLPMTNGEKG